MPVRLLLVAVALGTGLVACADEPEQPSTLPSLSAAPSASSSPSVAPTPSGIDAPTPEGASAFARYWYSQIEQAYVTKDAELISQLSAPGCEACERYIATVNRLRDQDERVDPFEYMILAAEAPAIEDDAESVNVTVIFDSDGTVFYDAEGNVILREPASDNAEQTLVLTRVGGSWRVEEALR